MPKLKTNMTDLFLKLATWFLSLNLTTCHRCLLPKLYQRNVDHMQRVAWGLRLCASPRDAKEETSVVRRPQTPNSPLSIWEDLALRPTSAKGYLVQLDKPSWAHDKNICLWWPGMRTDWNMSWNSNGDALIIFLKGTQFGIIGPHAYGLHHIRLKRWSRFHLVWQDLAEGGYEKAEWERTNLFSFPGRWTLCHYPQHLHLMTTDTVAYNFWHVSSIKLFLKKNKVPKNIWT